MVKHSVITYIYMLTNRDIKIRKPVWTALSELWLDKELQESDLNRIAETLFTSGYSLEKLREIYELEVAPIVYMNLFSPAGDWTGFDDEWLHEKIISSLNSRSHLAQFFLKLKRRIMISTTDKHWKVLEKRVNELKITK